MKQKVYSRWPQYQKVSPLADCIDKHRTTIWDVFILSWRFLEGPLCTVLSRKPSWPTSAQHLRHRTVCGVSVARAARRRDLQGAVQPWQRKRDLCLPAAGDAGTREKGVPTVRAETPCVVEEMGRQGTLSPAVKRNGLYSTAHRRLPRLTQKKQHTHFQIKKKKKSKALSPFLGSGEETHEMLPPKRLLACSSSLLPVPSLTWPRPLKSSQSPKAKTYSLLFTF